MDTTCDLNAAPKPVSGTGLWAMLTASSISVLIMMSLFFYAPYYSFSQIQRAADQGDQERFNDFVDVDSVRSALVTEIRKGIAAQLDQAQAKPEVLEMVEKQFVGPMVTRTINTDFMMHLLTGAAPPEGTRRTAPVNELATGHSALPEIKKGYDGVNRFVVRAKDEAKKTEIQFVLMRDGLGWRLDEVSIPSLIDDLTRESPFNKATSGAAAPPR